MKLSIAVIASTDTFPKQFLDSLDFADEIIFIIDSTEKKSKKQGKKSFYYRPLNNDFSGQRNFALEKTKGDWVLFVDDDEYVGRELRNELLTAIENEKFDGFLLHRVDTVYHYPLRHGETSNIKLLRLARRNAGKFRRPVHEYWQVKGKIGNLYSPLYHIKDHFVSGFISRMDQYGKIDSQILNKENKPFTWWRLFFNPVIKFKLNYYLKLGFLDGLPGLFLAYLMSVQSLSVRIFQWENLKK